MTLTWSTDASAGDWLAERIVGFAVDVGSIVPHGFEAYARVFHPLDDGPDRRWADRAARNGRIAHPEMQLHQISVPPGEPLPKNLLAGVRVGSLPRAELEALTAVLPPHTGTPERAWFAVWDGYGGLRDAHPPVLHVAGRSYALARGAVADSTGVAEALHDQSPSLWWPEDRAWCVATEIDFGWTYVAGSEAAVADVLASPALEALPSRVTDAVTWDGDLLNSALDPEA